MDMPLSGQAPSRQPIDLVAEGMWKIASGESSPECWEMLPEQQKNWWRSCATRVVNEWMTAAKDANHWGPGGAQQQPDRPPWGGRRFLVLARRLFGPSSLSELTRRGIGR
jgi:hypothetical protein